MFRPLILSGSFFAILALPFAACVQGVGDGTGSGPEQPPIHPSPESRRCSVDLDCDDGHFCNGDEACTDGVCRDGADPCRGNTPICIEYNTSCTGCVVDADCDDGAFCNGAESCADGTCVYRTAPCTGTQTCDEDTDACVTACDDAGDCGDDDLCTTDACVNGACTNDPVVCADDGAFCNGTASCDAATGACVSSGDPCAATADTPTCNEDADACETAPLCTADADCDDGLFCNGVEVCDARTRSCVAGTRPCDDYDGAGCDDPTGFANEFCSEGDTGAVCTPCSRRVPCTPPDRANQLQLTVGTDVLMGTSGDDLFLAPLVFNATLGIQQQTLQTADQLDGGAGYDILLITLNMSGYSTQLIRSIGANIEEICVTDFSAPPCDSDEHCADGLYCNGTETCDSAWGTCILGPSPCLPGETCDPTTGQCVGGSACPATGACRVLPACYSAGTPATVTIQVTPASETLVYGIEDSPPPGWSASSISHEGAWDVANRAVKWFFLHNEARTLTYTITPPASATGNLCFDGKINFNGGVSRDVQGTNCVSSCSGG